MHSGAPTLKTHVTGALVHGQRSHFYIDMLQWPHCPNLTITCLINAISSQRDSLPSTLYMQCDNCGRENKNRHVIGFLGYLCLAGYVKEVLLSFLIKGHTHEDVDQQFSKVSHHLRNVNAMTMPQLKIAVENSLNVKPYVEVLGSVWDTKSWLDGYLNDISNHSYQHQFWLYCDRPNHVSLKYRRFSTDNWGPETEDQLELFVLDTFGDSKCPRGILKTCKPNFDPDRMGVVKSSIQKIKNFLSHEELCWWMDFIKNPNNAMKRDNQFSLLKLKKVHRIEDIPIVPLQSSQNHTTSSISDMLQAEGESREIRAKGRKKATTSCTTKK